jgi:beta-galactosidase
MQQARMNVVRVAEFAWSRMEPREGAYDFGWLDRAIALAGERGMSVVLGTPTATPPAWLTAKYPIRCSTRRMVASRSTARAATSTVASATYRRLASNIAGRWPNVTLLCHT